MTTPVRTHLAVLTLPAFKDNYLWLIHDGSNAAIVDPGEAAPVKAALAAHKLRLTAILLTHHHADHIGGVPSLLEDWDVPVFGPRNDGIDLVTHPLGQGERIDVPGLGLALDVLDVPGHTLGHIAYVRREPGAQWLFCGDTLFGWRGDDPVDHRARERDQPLPSRRRGAHRAKPGGGWAPAAGRDASRYVRGVEGVEEYVLTVTGRVDGEPSTPR